MTEPELNTRLQTITPPDEAARAGYKNNLRFHYVLNYNIE